jgi:hypothetical protein
MPSRRRMSLVDGPHAFRSRLKRALSLSSSESSNETRSQRPKMNHSARHALSSDNNGAIGRRKVGVEADNREGYHWRPWEMKSENETSQAQTAFEGEPEKSTQNSIIALKCVSEWVRRLKIVVLLLICWSSLDSRMKSVHFTIKRVETMLIFTLQILSKFC